MFTLEATRTPTLPMDDAGRLLITGDEARELDRHVRTYCVDRDGRVESVWREVQGLNECRHGCKLYVRRRGAILCYRLMHNANYGCSLATGQGTATVPVAVLPNYRPPRPAGAPAAAGDRTRPEYLAGWGTGELREG